MKNILYFIGFTIFTIMLYLALPLLEIDSLYGLVVFFVVIFYLNFRFQFLKRRLKEGVDVSIVEGAWSYFFVWPTFGYSQLISPILKKSKIDQNPSQYFEDKDYQIYHRNFYYMYIFYFVTFLFIVLWMLAINGILFLT